MGTLLYIICKLAKMVDEPNDWVHLTQLVALDSIAFVLLLHWWQQRRKN